MAVKREPKILDLEDFDESINMLIYADSGVGKTVFAGTAPKTLFIATENGTISAKRHGSTAKVWPVETWEDVQDAYLYLRDEDHGFNWVALDSVTAMQQMLLRWILDRAVAENSSRDPDIPQIQEHQKWQNMFKRFIQKFVDLPVNTIFTATTMRHEDEEGESIILPDLQGKGYGISQWVCAQMHVVGYMKVMQKGKGEDKSSWRRILFQTRPPYFGKDRYSCLGEYNENGSCIVPYLDDVDIPTVQKLIEASGNPGEKKRPAVSSKPKNRRRRSATEAVESAQAKVSDDDDEDMEDDE